MSKTDLLQKILVKYTPLVLDKDLFYLEMPLDKSGFWYEPAQIDNNRTEKEQFDIYARYKSKPSARANIEYFQEVIDNLEDCKYNNQIFKLRLLYKWSYVGKDAEGYFIFTNTIEII